MTQLERETNSQFFKESYIGKNGWKKVICILDDDCVRYVVCDTRKPIMKAVIKRREYKNDKKQLCFERATQELNKEVLK